MGKITHYYVIYWFLFLNAGCPQEENFVAHGSEGLHLPYPNMLAGNCCCDWLTTNRILTHYLFGRHLCLESSVQQLDSPRVAPARGLCQTWFQSPAQDWPNRTEYVAVNHENIWKPLEKRTVIQQKWCESKKLPNYQLEKLQFSNRLRLQKVQPIHPNRLGVIGLVRPSRWVGSWWRLDRWQRWCLVMIFLEKLRGPALDVYEICCDRFQTIGENSKVGSSWYFNILVLFCVFENLAPVESWGYLQHLALEIDQSPIDSCSKLATLGGQTC